MVHDSEGVTDCVQQRGSTKVVGGVIGRGRGLSEVSGSSKVVGVKIGVE